MKHRWLIPSLWRFPAVAALTVALMAAACSDEATIRVGAGDDLASMSARLVAFDTCADLDTYLRGVVMSEVDAAFTLLRSEDGYYGGWGVPVASGGAELGGRGEATSDGGPTAPSAGGDQGGTTAPTGDQDNASEEYSDTNTQEAGVDEADIVKTDGTRLFLLTGNVLRIVQAAPVDSMALLSTTEIEGSPIEMFLAGDRAIVFSRQYFYNHDGEYGYPGGAVGGGSSGAAVDMDAPVATPSSSGGAGSAAAPLTDAVAAALAELQGEVLKVTVLDLADPSAPAVVRESYFEGSYVSSRLSAGTAHAVLHTYPHLPAIDYYSYYGGGPDVAVGRPEPGGTAPMPSEPVAVDAGSASSGEVPPADDFAEKQAALTADQEAALEAARDAFVERLNAMSLEDIMPKRIDVVDGAPVVSLIVPCQSFYRPSVTMGLNILAILSFDPNEDASVINGAAILGSSDTVYASPESLYVATYVYDYWMWNRWAESNAADVVERTALHAFDIAAFPGEAVYRASGFVQGRVLNQFSLSEYEGYFRVATTWRNWMTGDPAENGIFVLQPQGDALVVVGSAEIPEASGEEIYAARFFGDKGYVVTYERTDPLFTFDMSDPTNPVRVGLLEIPGYSSYIHPLGEGFLLTIGRMTDDRGEWVEMGGVKLAVYDVRDFANPTEVQSHVIGGGETHSEAEYNHKAFTYFAPLQALAIPIGSYYWGFDPAATAPQNGLSVFHVDTTAGFSPFGTVSHLDFVALPSDLPEGYTCYGYVPEVRRSVFIGDRVYSISDLGVKANQVAAGLPELAAVAFPAETVTDSLDARPWMGFECYYAGDREEWPTEEEPREEDKEEPARDEMP